MDKYGEMGDSIYCYPNSDVLKNNLNIQDAEILQQAELELTEYISTRIEYPEPPYDLKYLFKLSTLSYFQIFILGLVD
jgi:cell filamentation protein